MTTGQTVNAILKVVHPGLCTLVVDGGRPHYRSLGVPVGGAADRAALALGNALVGNPPDAAALEVALAGPTLVADAELACVLFGAPFDLATDRRTLSAGKTFTLQPGEVLHVGGTALGARAYFCVRGGLQTPVVLGSRSSLEPLKTGAEIPCRSGNIPARFIELTDWLRPLPALRVLHGRRRPGSRRGISIRGTSSSRRRATGWAYGYREPRFPSQPASWFRNPSARGPFR